LNLLPNGGADLRAVPQKASFRKLHGFLKGKTNGKVLTTQEMDKAIADAGTVAGASE
jgi:hypothetical protein